MSDFEDEEVIMSGPEDDNDQKKAENDEDEEQFDENDVMKILIATDIHLGYEETTKRAQEDDSFLAFEEILQYAKEREVDMLLLGGDLFHEAKPPHHVVMRCINLLRTYCLDDRPVRIQFLTDPTVIFNHCIHKTVNYEDPNLNIGLPVFSIHGNHDDPSFGAVGSMDVLSSTGLINYFGKWTDVTNVSIPPLLLRKGATTVALYGLSYMNDQRLSRLMRNDKFKLLQAKNVKDPFNILVLHQNRAQHSQNAYVPENLIPKDVNLVIWGHEHECMIMPEQSTQSPVFICQPGSSVATSLAQGESVEKQVGILSVYKTKFKMEPLKLKSVRAFVFDNLVLNDHKDEISPYKSRSEAVEEFTDHYIENILMVEVAKRQTGHPKQPAKPLIRLRIFYAEDKDVFDPLKISQKYYQEVANPNDMIMFKKCPARMKKKDIKKSETAHLDEIGEIFKFDNGEKDWKLTVFGGMSNYFNQQEKLNKITVLSLTGLNGALSRFVSANDTKAIEDIVKHQIEKTKNYLMSENLKTKEEYREAILRYRDLRNQQEEKEREEDDKFFNSRGAAPPSMDEPDVIDEPAPPTRGRGRGRGRGGGRGRGAAAKPKEPPTNVTPTKRSRTKAPALDISLDRSSQSINAWKKPSQNNSRTTNKPIILDSDSD